LEQLIFEKLESIYGNVLPVQQIWQTYKGHKYDIEKTLEDLAEKTGKKTDIAIFTTLTESVKKSKSKTKKIQEMEDEQKSKGFRTSEEVYNRIKWDNDYNKLEFRIGYEDRFDGLQEVEFNVWEIKDVSSENFIPWHRVQYFKQQEDIVWDRRTRKDYIFGPNEKEIISE